MQAVSGWRNPITWFRRIALGEFPLKLGDKLPQTLLHDFILAEEVRQAGIMKAQFPKSRRYFCIDPDRDRGS